MVGLKDEWDDRRDFPPLHIHLIFNGNTLCLKRQIFNNRTGFIDAFEGGINTASHQRGQACPRIGFRLREKTQ
jgi:hypothetical protein